MSCHPDAHQVAIHIDTFLKTPGLGEEVQTWVVDNVELPKYDSHIMSGFVIMWFDNIHDAVAFKLRFSDYLS